MINSKVLMIGPDSTGGITSVIKLYLNNGLEKIRFVQSYDGKKLIFRYLLFLAEYLKLLLFDKDVQIVHIHTASRGSFYRKSIAAKIAKLFGKKVILHIHGAEFNVFYDESPKFIKCLIKNVLDNVSSIVVLSRQWRKDIAKKTSNKNIRVLYNPTVMKEFSYSNSETVNVLFMGRIGQRKGIFDIIKASEYIHDPNIQIWLYGDGDIEKAKELVQQNNLQDKVNIAGWISGSKIGETYQKADIYLLPSYNEGLPMSILEAMAHGLPIISTPVGGIPEAVKENINGYLIEPGDYKALAEKIHLLANDHALRMKMGQESYRIAKENFDIKNIVNELKNIYEEQLR